MTKHISTVENGSGRRELLAVRIEKALATLGNVETELRQLRLSRLHGMADSLAAAAADIESLRSFLPAAASNESIHGHSNAAIRARLEKLGHLGRRVCALYEAAQQFHAGLARVRAQDSEAYDALGTVRVLCDSQPSLGALETRG